MRTKRYSEASYEYIQVDERKTRPQSSLFEPGTKTLAILGVLNLGLRQKVK
jgi:hypothetical protein